MHPFFQKLSASKIYLFIAAFLGFGFLVGETDFAKLGIPLPLKGSAAVSVPSLFVFELFLLFSFLIVVILQWRGRISISEIGKFHWLLVVYLALLLPKIFFEISEDPITVIRNSSFVWYIALPILAGLIPISSQEWERFFWRFSIAVLLWLGFSVVHFFIAKYLFDLDPLNMTRFEFYGVRWSQFFGVYSGLFFVLLSKRRLWPLVAIFVFGLSFGIEASTKFSRTNLLGCIFSIAICFWVSRYEIKNLKRILLRIVFMIIVASAMHRFILASEWYNRPTNLIFTEFGVDSQDKGGLSVAPKSLVKSALVDSGTLGMVEGFRYYMYKDAWELFTQHPWWGIQYKEQVVHRFFVGGQRQFRPNIGIHYEPVYLTTPISGPHNSYLNALARVGIIGIGFLFFHIFCLVVLFKRRLYATFFALTGGVLYAFFNVGLEGPARSFFLLLAMAVTIRALGESNEKNHKIF